MSAGWLHHELSGPEQRNHGLRDFRVLAPALAPAWLALALLGLCAGAAWRFLPQAQPPGLFVLLDAAAVALWLCGWLLAAGAQDALARQQTYLQAQPDDGMRRLQLCLALLAAAVLLALAPLGALLAFDFKTELAEVGTLDPLDFRVRLGPYLVIVLLALAAPLSLLSAGVRLLSARAGALGGACIWLLVGLGLNLRFITGLTGSQAANLPPSVSHFALSWLGQLARAGQEYLYLRDIVDDKIGLALLLTAVGLAACAAGLLLQRGRPLAAVPRPLALAAWAALAVVAVRAIGQQQLYASDVAYRFPGDWRALVLAGVATLWLLYALLGRPARSLREQARALGWLPAAAAGWLVATLPNVRADQVGRSEVLAFVLAAFAAGALGLAVLDAAQRLRGRLGGLPTLALTALPLLALLPLDGGSDSLLRRGLQAVSAETVTPLLVLVLVLAATLAAAILLAGRLVRRQVRKVAAAEG